MEENELTTSTGLSKEQKIGFILLLAFAFLAIGLGVLQIRNTMYGRFALNDKTPITIKDQVNTVDALRFRDTDKDGLNDFEELYVYSTSPYLADFDSDGILDGDEVKKSTNPLCAEGKDCSVNPEEAFIIANSSTIGIDSVGVNSSTVAAEVISDFQATISDPAKVRKLLLESGVSADVINNISDSELMGMINEMMNSSSTAQNIQDLNSSLTTSTKK